MLIKNPTSQWDFEVLQAALIQSRLYDLKLVLKQIKPSSWFSLPQIIRNITTTKGKAAFKLQILEFFPKSGAFLPILDYGDILN